MNLVLDSSYAIDAVLDDDLSKLEPLRTWRIIAPSVYVDECRNVAVRAIRHRAVSREFGLTALNSMLFMPIAIHTVGTEAVMEAAFEYGLNGFDASFIALAVERGDAVATLDRSMQRAAESLGLVVIG